MDLQLSPDDEPKVMSEPEIAEHLKHIPLWTRESNTITRIITPIRYHAGVALIVHVADLSRLIHHHADIHLGAGTSPTDRPRPDSIRFTITSHDAGEVLTDADFLLARGIDQLVATHSSSWDIADPHQGHR
ncbi:4a-hydroxytetrahydrobiopterin dehydratase [Streptomyces sp. NPDC005529]|uniref:4a-hydroxytetrahydrobiopterin dehydratase n=1 Tax=unclassified Streptomyces TaxID=2593676 RepID=UPI0033B890B6